MPVFTGLSNARFHSLYFIVSSWILMDLVAEVSIFHDIVTLSSAIIFGPSIFVCLHTNIKFHWHKPCSVPKKYIRCLEILIYEETETFLFKIASVQTCKSTYETSLQVRLE